MLQKYFEKFPVEKIPKINSTGEKYREKQLIIQLPVKKQNILMQKQFLTNIITETRFEY